MAKFDLIEGTIMAKYDYGGGCACGLYRECTQDCKNNSDAATSQDTSLKAERTGHWLSAEAARKLSGPSEDDLVHDAVTEACEMIHAAALQKKRSVAMYTKVWAYDGYYGSPIHKRAKETLINLGYHVTFHHHEHSVDTMHTTVEW